MVPLSHWFRTLASVDLPIKHRCLALIMLPRQNTTAKKRVAAFSACLSFLFQSKTLLFTFYLWNVSIPGEGDCCCTEKASLMTYRFSDITQTVCCLVLKRCKCRRWLINFRRRYFHKSTEAKPVDDAKSRVGSSLASLNGGHPELVTPSPFRPYRPPGFTVVHIPQTSQPLCSWRYVCGFACCFNWAS